jgi:1-acyl-sn-glycerol-3-phosphate acyltransferase
MKDGPAQGPPGAAAREGASAAEPLTHVTWVYWLVREVLRCLYAVYFRHEVRGRERLPQHGSLLLVINHQSFLDIPLVAMAVPRHVSFVARASLAHSAPLAWLMERCGAVLIRPGSPDRAALRGMRAHLERGDCVAIFPEGTRSPDGSLLEFRPGAALVARQTGARVVPVAIHRTGRALGRHARWPRPRKIGLEFLAPCSADSTDPLQDSRAAIAAALERAARDEPRRGRG